MSCLRVNQRSARWFWMCWCFCLSLVFVIAGCGAETKSLLPPDTKRTGTRGQDGPQGAALRVFTTQARISGMLQADVIFPADAKGELDQSKAPYPVVLLIQGGLVAKERYHWLATHIASRGFVVLLPQHLGDLAINEQANARIALSGLRAAAEEPGPWQGMIAANGPVVAMGHSLGAVIATWNWLAREKWRGVALLAAWPDDEIAVKAREQSKVLVLVGSEDGSAPPARVKEGFATFSGQRVFGLIQGMNHYDWTDGTTAAELEKDKPGAKDLPQTRLRVQALLDTWLDAVLRDDKKAKQRLQTASFAGIEVTR